MKNGRYGPAVKRVGDQYRFVFHCRVAILVHFLYILPATVAREREQPRLGCQIPGLLLIRYYHNYRVITTGII